MGYPSCGKGAVWNGSVTGHDFSRAARAPQNESALAAAEVQIAENKYRRGPTLSLRIFGTTEVVPCYKTELDLSIFPSGQSTYFHFPLEFQMRLPWGAAETDLAYPHLRETPDAE
jgi:hypothetical protein